MNVEGNARMKNILFLLAVTMGPLGIGVATFAEAARSPGHVASTKKHAISYHLAWHRVLAANADSTTVVDSNVRLKSGKHVTLAIVVAGNNGSDCDPGNPVKHATTYAFDATTGKLVWKQSTSGQGRCTTAAAAVSGSWVYSPGLDGRIHKYAAATGKAYRKSGWPKLFTTQPYVEKSSSNLVISGHYLYLATSGFIGDAGHYEGHVATVNLLTGHENVWNSLCSNIHALITDNSGSKTYCPDVQSGMFGRGQAAIDPLNKDVYFVTGNGPWNGKTDWGDSVLRVSPDGSRLLDAFTPTNQAYLNNSDSDLGSTGSAIIPPVTSNGKTYRLLVQGGKGPSGSSSGPAVIWLVNRDQMGSKPGPGHLGGSLQHVQSPGGCEVLTAPAVWVDSHGTPVVIYANDCGTNAYNIVTSSSAPPKLSMRWSISGRATTPVLSNGTLYIGHDGEVDAYDPSNAKQLWSTSNAGVGGSIGSIHWEYPSVSRNWLFMTDESGTLFAYKRR
ncbi:MAG TPA: PQQ-binding-like beta-propeller repeat protein [Chloroflexota bacterium]|nr:PQQ-binding-like beta-propeller repeat protein [Chloroflexota bacterium]